MALALKPREAAVLKMRLGINMDKSLTLKEAGVVLKVTRQGALRIQNSALRRALFQAIRAGVIEDDLYHRADLIKSFAKTLRKGKLVEGNSVMKWIIAELGQIR